MIITALCTDTGFLEEMAMAELTELRAQIDKIDAELVGLLNRRADIVFEVKKAKEKDKLAVYAADRERQIVDRVMALSEGGSFPKPALERIFINIISATRSLIGGISVSYLGPEHSLEHEAALKQFGSEVQYLPDASIEDVLSRVERGDALYGVLPAQASSPAGQRLLELLVQSPLVIIAEVELKEQLSLFSRSRNLSAVRRVYAPALVFSRCETWLKANLPGAERIVQEHIAAQLAELEQDEGAGCIGVQALGERFSLPLLAGGIQNDAETASRFIVVGQKATSPTGNDKTSLVCTVKDRAGALRDILRPFAERGITLLNIESRALKNPAWEYAFFIDFAGHESDQAVRETVDELKQISSFARVLGSYPLVGARL
ncbi:MAG TPA: prephenate dehydratase domain-containing protein [Oligoflexia bacterium]|nr:prephenate dehydratase domain-containing protein [Oligoflexia bacterium]